MNAQPKVIKPVLKLHNKQLEAKKVSVDDGYTQIPNELLKAILRSGVLGWKGSYLLATVLKTLSWHKESDWFTHSQVCEMMDIEPTKYHINQLSAARKELIRENILFENGKKTGVNLSVFDWKMVYPEKVGRSRNNRESVPEIVGSGYPEKVGNTKETLTKEKINITPLPPKGESADADLQAVEKVKKFAKPKIEYQAIMDLYNQANESSGSRLPFAETISEKRKRAMNKFWHSLRNQTLDGVENYFEAFFDNLTPHQLGKNDRGWRASFDFAIREEIVIRVREGNL